MSGALSYAFLKEEIEKQNRKSNFVHFENFRTNINRVPITSKFWSKYESKIENPNEEKHQNYLNQIERAITETPKDKYREPMTESQKYGKDPLPPSLILPLINYGITLIKDGEQKV